MNYVRYVADIIDGFQFQTTKAISNGNQVFVHYGDKKNAELLMGYGFMLPESADVGVDADSYLLHFQPTERQAIELRTQQACYTKSISAAQEFKFVIAKQIDGNFFPHDLIDLFLCMLANERERKYYLCDNSHFTPCCPGSTALRDLLGTPLYSKYTLM